MIEHFGFGKDSKQAVGINGEKEDEEQPGDEIELEGHEATMFRAVSARVNYLSLGCPD